jgi:hypothetical protein
VVIAHEVIHTIHKTKQPDIILKLDYEKAYDRVNLDFLIEILESRGFGETWIGWIKTIVFGGSASILANGEDINTFKTGWPLSPLLFNWVGDVLTRMLAKATGSNLVKGVIEQFRSGGIVSLQYVDDTLLFSDVDPAYLRNLRIVLSLFEKISEMRINFNKNEFIPLNLEEELVHEVGHTLICGLGSLPLKYLEVSLHFEKLKRKDVHPLVDKLAKRMAGWRGRLLTYSSRLTFIQLCLASIPIYLLSFIKFPKWAIKLIESQMAHCL